MKEISIPLFYFALGSASRQLGDGVLLLLAGDVDEHRGTEGAGLLKAL